LLKRIVAFQRALMTIPLPLDTPTMMVMVTAGTMALAVAMAVVRPDRREGIGLWRSRSWRTR